MKQKFLGFLLSAALLVGCSSPTVNTKSPLRTITALRVLPTAVRTLVPATTAYPAAAPTYPFPSDAPYPVSQTEAALVGTAYPIPQPLVAASPSIQLTAVPFQDCARTPGLVGCAPDAIPLKARLAYMDTAPARLVALDLENGQGWQVPLPPGLSPDGLAWSPAGPGEPRLLLSLGDHRYEVLSAGGKSLEHVTSQTPLSWQPDAALSKDGAVHAENGDQAFLEQTADLHWLLHVKTAQGEKSLPLDSDPGDILYALLGWVPGAQTLLAQSYFAGNQAMTQGGQVITIDSNSAAIQTYPARLPLSDSPAQYYAWDPTRPARLAFLESSETGVITPRLALLDLKTGQLQYPLPEGLLPTNLAWNPDGRLAFAVNQIDALTSPEARKSFPTAGIYLLDPRNGQVQSLVSSPPGAVDTWPHWTADGQNLLYARVLTSPNGASPMQVRARRLGDGAEWVLVEGLPGSQTANEPVFANRWLAFSAK